MEDPTALLSTQGRPVSLPLTQSTAPLRQKSSSILKDTVDPIAAEPDTHRRLDVAPASTPGGLPTPPSFPTEVSELISAQTSPYSQLTSPDVEALDSEALAIPDIEPKLEAQLPDIHDLLPAVEPDESASEEIDSSALKVSAERPSSDMGLNPLEASPVVDSARRLSPGEQVTLFSFDITETTSVDAPARASSERQKEPVLPVIDGTNVFSEEPIVSDLPEFTEDKRLKSPRSRDDPAPSRRQPSCLFFFSRSYFCPHASDEP